MVLDQTGCLRRLPQPPSSLNEVGLIMRGVECCRSRRDRQKSMNPVRVSLRMSPSRPRFQPDLVLIFCPQTRRRPRLNGRIGRDAMVESSVWFDSTLAEARRARATPPPPLPLPTPTHTRSSPDSPDSPDTFVVIRLQKAAVP